MKTKTEQEQIAAAQRVAAHLCGTCGGTDVLIAAEPALRDLDEMQVNILLELYGEIFLCAGCNWWSETEEMDISTGDQLCPDCFADSRADDLDD